MKRIYDKYCIWKVFIRVENILIVRAGDEILRGITICCSNGNKRRLVVYDYGVNRWDLPTEIAYM